MIVLSRSRTETDRDAEWAASLVACSGVSVLSIPFLYDLRSFGPTVERLRQLEAPSHFVAPLPVRASKNLLDTILKPRPASEVFAAIVDSGEIETVEELLDRLAMGFSENADSRPDFKPKVERLDEPTVRRWYPVVDAPRCTGCLECVNFCLFGVYVIGANDRPIVDQPDACRDGCPACSRVCPGRAILFPMHEDKTIAGYLDAMEDRNKTETDRADEERRRYLPSEPDTLDELVDRVDRFSP